MPQPPQRGLQTGRLEALSDGRPAYELSPEQYAAVVKLLKQQHPLVMRYWHDATAHIEDFKSGKIVASSGWGYQVNALKAQLASHMRTAIAAGELERSKPSSGAWMR